MKKAAIISLAVVAVIVIGLLVANAVAERQIKTEITINASAGDVWEVLMDHQNYPEWNPFIKRFNGDPQPGQFVEITVQPSGQDPMTFQPEILKNEQNREFRWVGKLLAKGLFDGEHYFILEPTEDGQTKLIHGENFEGLLVGSLLWMIHENTLRGFNEMNAALKDQAESKSSVVASER